jgi:chromosome segregation ATPase
LNKILISKDEEIVQNRTELEKQDTKIHKFQQQIKESQQQISNIKSTHKKESENINKELLSKDEEISRLRNHNKSLLVDMKKLKNKRKAQQETQTMDKGTSTDLIDMEKPNVLNNEVVSVEVFPEVISTNNYMVKQHPQI